MKMKKPFRQSREAIILDTLLLPAGLIWSILVQGIPETIQEIKHLSIRQDYKASYWYLLS